MALPLKVRSGALAGLADSVADPRSARFRRFRTIPQLAAAYGASVADISSDEQVLTRDGMQLSADPTHGALWGNVTAAQVKRYFGTTLIESGGRIEPAGAPHVPPGMVGVTSVIGLVGSTSLSSSLNGGSAKPACPSHVPSRSSVARLFGFNHLIQTGATGRGTEIDILAVHSLQPAVTENFDRCTGASLSSASLDQSVVPDTPNTGGGPEIALDALVLTLLAPAAHIHVARFDPATPFVFPLMHILQLGRPPNILDVTVTVCEGQITPSELALSEWMLAAFAAAGTTTAAAAGDRGSSGCYPATGTSVTYPASSSFVVAIGGASYDGSADAPSRLAAWNQPKSNGGGGGVSAAVPAPPWQGPGRREVPDVSTYAVPGGVGSIPVCVSSSDCAWQPVGGTSLGATVMGATGLLLEQELGKRRVDERWGNVAGAIWRKAKDAKAITDIVHGSNKTFSSACCRAGPGYDTASGWGLMTADYLPRIVPVSSR